MVSKVIKLSEENYLWLLKIASDLQRKVNRPISFDETIWVLRGKEVNHNGLMSLAGSWKISDMDAKLFLKSARKGWKNWKIPSV